MNSTQKLLFKILLILQNVLVKLMYSFPLTYFPLVAKQYKLSLSTIGAILGIYPIGTILITMSYEYINAKISKKYFYFMNAISMQFGLLFFGYATNFQDPNMFIIFSTLARFMQGYSASISIMVYEIIFSLYPEEITTNQAIIELFGLATISCGPTISIFMNNEYGGYKNMFYALCIIFLIINAITIFLVFYYNIHKDKTMQSNYQSQIQTSDFQEKFKIKCNSQVNFTNLISTSIFCAYMFVISLYSNYLSAELNFNTRDISYSFMAIGLGYILGSLYFTSQKPKQQNQKQRIYIGHIFILFSMFFCYQQKQMGFPNSKIVIYVANFCLGLSDQIGCIQTIPELIRLFNEQDSDPKKQQYYNQKASVYYNLAFFIAEFMGPIISGCLFDLFGYEQGVHIYILFTLFFIVFPYSIQGNFQNKNQYKNSLEKDENVNLIKKQFLHNN